jgi:hypothetical protein
VVLTVLVVTVGIGGLVLSRDTSKKKATPKPQPTTTLATLPDTAFVAFHDPETGTTIRYPRGWQRSEAPDREIRLLVSDGRQYSCLVRVTRTQEPTTPANLDNLRPVTEGFISPNVKQMLKEDTVTVNGLIGFRYIYTTNTESGLEAAHLHYFLFQGHKMNSIVFEAVPTGDFSRIEGVFDQMLQSFHSDPEPGTETTPPPGQSTTTTRR